MSNERAPTQSQAIQDEIALLERRLQDAKCRLNARLISQQATSEAPAKILQSAGNEPPLWDKARL
jgi:hypothetical protein